MVEGEGGQRVEGAGVEAEEEKANGVERCDRECFAVEREEDAVGIEEEVREDAVEEVAEVAEELRPLLLR